LTREGGGRGQRSPAPRRGAGHPGRGRSAAGRGRRASIVGTAPGAAPARRGELRCHAPGGRCRRGTPRATCRRRGRAPRPGTAGRPAGQSRGRGLRRRGAAEVAPDEAGEPAPVLGVGEEAGELGAHHLVKEGSFRVSARGGCAVGAQRDRPAAPALACERPLCRHRCRGVCSRCATPLRSRACPGRPSGATGGRIPRAGPRGPCGASAAGPPQGGASAPAIPWRVAPAGGAEYGCRRRSVWRGGAVC